jgi:hypothetical protein
VFDRLSHPKYKRIPKDQWDQIPNRYQSQIRLAASEKKNVAFGRTSLGVRKTSITNSTQNDET